MKETINELTVKDFDNMQKILNNDKLDNIDKWLQIATVFGEDENKLDEYDVDDILNFINKIKNQKFDNELVMIKNIEIDGYNYVAYTEDVYKMKAKDLSVIETYLKKDNYMAYILAVIFKREDLTKKEHYDDAHIKHKSTLFDEFLIKDFIPYFNYIIDKVSKKIKMIIDDANTSTK
jgi:hypothetical protein